MLRLCACSACSGACCPTRQVFTRVSREADTCSQHGGETRQPARVMPLIMLLRKHSSPQLPQAHHQVWLVAGDAVDRLCMCLLHLPPGFAALEVTQRNAAIFTACEHLQAQYHLRRLAVEAAVMKKEVTCWCGAYAAMPRIASE